MTRSARTAKPAHLRPSNVRPANLRKLNQQGVIDALKACESKKAGDLTLLEMDKASSAFTDYFVICSGTNPRQIQAIADEVQQSLEKRGQHPLNVEGYRQAEWVLLDYVDFVVHIFSEPARKFYDLERLWKSAKRVTPATLVTRSRAAAKPKAAARKKSARVPAKKPSRAAVRKRH
jgi:ribosome-associated protein